MKRFIILALMAFGAAQAQNVTVQNESLGSGTPGSPLVNEEAVQVGVGSDYYHAPQYMPQYPTAATIWPRVVTVDCVKTIKGLRCDGYHWTPDLGRGEYLFIQPRIKEEPKPILVPVPVDRPVIVYKEVPAKKTKE